MTITKKKTPISLILCIIYSLVLFLKAPDEYSITFCIASSLPFFYSAYVLFKERCKYNLVSFESTFTVVFFYVNYSYPLFLYPIMPYFSLFNLPFPENYINSGICLSTIGYCCYVVGSLKYPVLPFVNKPNIMPCYKLIRQINIGLLLLLVVQLLPVLRSGVYDGNWGDGALTKTVVDSMAFFVVFSALTKADSIKSFVKGNKLLFFHNFFPLWHCKKCAALKINYRLLNKPRNFQV